MNELTAATHHTHETPLAVIVIVTWNGKNDTLECLASLQAVSYPNFTILLVDNASTDGTAEAVAEHFPQVELIRAGRNLRFAGGTNLGIRRALALGAEYIVLLNNDTIVEPDFLTELVATAQHDPSIGLVGATIYYHSDPHRIWFAGGEISWWKGWIAHTGIRQLDRGQFDAVRETAYITGCCLLAKRDVIERIGLLDETYFMYGEDADWCLRARRAGYRLVVQPKAKLWHKVSVSAGGHFSWFKNWNKFKSTLRLMRRYARPSHWLIAPLLLPWMIVRGAIASFWMSIEKDAGETPESR